MVTGPHLHDSRPAELGEGPLWHPERGELFWFDILGYTLMAAGRIWHFAEHVSAAGWIDHDTLLIASETGLHRFDIASGTATRLVALEADRPATRSNDGRADPWGGFWIGTMGKHAEPGAGAIYRYHRGALRRLHEGLTIPNAICFSPDARFACFADTPTRRIMRQPLDPEDGWPAGPSEPFIDLTAEGRNPDGAVFDRDGRLWCAEWGSGRVACHDMRGRFVESVAFDAPHTSCPAFGGPELNALYCTTAREGLDAAALRRHPNSGCTMVAQVSSHGLSEHRVTV